MNTRLLFFLLIFPCLAGTLQAQTTSWDDLAGRIVNETAGVRAGNVVLVRGGKHTLPLMEQIAAELHKIGAHPMMVVESDVALKALLYEKPETNLADYPEHIVKLLSAIDYEINLPLTENGSEIYKGVDPKRFALLGSTSDKLMNELSESSHSSDIIIGFPSEQAAEASGIDFAQYEKMHWAAMNVDYRQIAAQGQKIKSLLKGAKLVRITTKEGTNITFSMGDRQVFSDDGILSDEERSSKIMFARFASLPGGWMDFAPLESSVNGTVVVPRMRCNFEPMSNASFVIRNGVMESFKAETGESCFTERMAPHSGNKNAVSVFTLGLNPEMKVIQQGETDFRPNTAAGFITMSIGGNNSQYNGIVNATGGYNFPLVNPTLEIDGKVVVKDGKLML
jgi:aminopeptidase